MWNFYNYFCKTPLQNDLSLLYCIHKYKSGVWEVSALIWQKSDIRTVTAKEYEEAAAALDPVKKARLSKTRQRKERLRTVAADMLARRMLAEALGLSANGLDFSYSENGNPLPVGGYYFSLSQSEDLVAAVISPSPVGIHLEKIREIDTVCARKYFTAGEISYIFGHEPTDQEWKDRVGEPGVRMRYYEIYTAKRAVAKCRDTDLSHIKQTDTTRMEFTHHLDPEDYVITVYEAPQ